MKTKSQSAMMNNKRILYDEIEERIFPDVVILRKLLQKSPLTEKERTQLENLSKKFELWKNEAEERGIKIPRIEDYVVIEKQQRELYSNEHQHKEDEIEDLEYKIRRIQQEIVRDIVILKSLREKSGSKWNW